MFFVYKIVHQPSGHFYVGQSENPKRRLGLHYADCWRAHTPLSVFMRTTEIKDWELEILYSCDSRKDAYDTESRLVKDLDARKGLGLNGTQGGADLSSRRKQGKVLVDWVAKNGGPRKGAIVSDETRALQSERKQGNDIAKTHLHRNPEAKARWLESVKKQGRRVRCETTGDEFASVAEAAAFLGVGRCDIRRVCNKQRNHVKNHVFAWVE